MFSILCIAKFDIDDKKKYAEIQFAPSLRHSLGICFAEAGSRTVFDDQNLGIDQYDVGCEVRSAQLS